MANDDHSAYRRREGTSSDVSSVSSALGRPVFTFKQTPPMSTYLVATVVSKFESTPSTSTSHVLWSKPNTESQRKYGAKYVAPVMDALVEFTGMPYEIGNITKMDNVAVPGMFSGAMENWGLVTYRYVTSCNSTLGNTVNFPSSHLCRPRSALYNQRDASDQSKD